MEDRHNTGGTCWLDKDGKELTEQEYMKLQNKAQSAAAEKAAAGEEKEETTDAR